MKSENTLDKYMKKLKKSFFIALLPLSLIGVNPLSAQNARGQQAKAGEVNAAQQTVKQGSEAGLSSREENSSDLENAITLPDVSTEIQGGAPKAGKSAVPDFSRILPARQTSELVPRLPEATAPDSSASRDISLSKAEEKSIYAEVLYLIN